MRISSLFAGCWLLSILCAAQIGTQREIHLTYELYSWQDAKGNWSFCLLYTTNRQKTVQEVFNKKTALRGISKLKRRIDILPAHSDIVWFDRLTLSGKKIKGSEGLKYPPKEILGEIKKYAAEHHVVISGPQDDGP